ncbi:cell wall-binding repeat-containing protein [Agromyces allii]|uniref:Cell wall-binding repeat-containing protein n=1 Tax=Agromyces allii TaxID=393607 RepID=A0ABN2QBU0_9MICO|nr:cell wall-binding repeat-containing protein [Agromyces allii]
MPVRSSRIRAIAVALAAAALLLSSLTLVDVAPAEAIGVGSITGTIELEGRNSERVDCSASAVDVRGGAMTTAVHAFSCTSFSIGELSPGEYRILIEARSSSRTWSFAWYGDVSSPYDAQHVTVRADGTSDPIEVHVPLGGSIAGTISTKKPTNGDLSAHAYFVDADDRISDRPIWSGTVGADGSYTIDSLAAGRYVVSASERGEAPANWGAFAGGGREASSARRFDVVAGQTTLGVDIELPGPGTPQVSRLAGPDRYSTAVQVTNQFAPGIPVLYLASGTAWADALSAGPAAALLHGALLLTDPAAIPAQVKAEIVRLKPARIVIVGSESAVSRKVFDEAVRLAPEVRRVGGRNRYATSQAIITDAFGTATTDRPMFVATGRNFPDALSGGAAAAQHGEPLLLIDGSSETIDDATRVFLHTASPTDIIAIGSPSVINPMLFNELRHFPSMGDSHLERWGGTNRYDTNQLVLRQGSRPVTPSNRVYVVNGEGFADAISAIPLAAASGSALLLSKPTCLAKGTSATATTLRITDWVLIGSKSVLSDGVAKRVSC